jgi:hypothetical protein
MDLAPPHKPVPLEATEASVGPWTIHARPKPWRATAVPAEFELEVEGPKGQELLIDYDWIHYGMWGYNPPKKCGIWAFSNKPYGLTVNPRMDVPMRGVLHVVKAVPVEFIVSKNPSIPNQIDLLYDGKCVQAGWRQNSCPPAAFGFKAFRIEDTFFGNATPMYLKDAIDPPAGSGWQSGSKFKDGQVIGGFAYRIVKSYPFELPLRRPVSKETLSFGTHPKL